MKKSLLTLCFMGLGVAVSASEYAVMDSVGIEKKDGKTFIIHEIDQKETLFGIARRYDAPMNDIITANPTLAGGLQPGQRIRIPYQEKQPLPEGAKLHKVMPGETLFAIAKTHNVTVQEVSEWNNLNGNGLNVGQNLIIKEGKKPEASAPSTAAQTPAAAPQREERRAEASREAAPRTSSTDGEWVMHTVAAGETLFSLAKDYDTKVDDIIRWNLLTSTNLAPGQKLKVSQREGGSVPARATTQAPAQQSQAANQQRSQPQNQPKSADADKADVAQKWIETVRSEKPAENPRPVVHTRNAPVEEESTERKNVKETGQAEVIEGTGNHTKYLVLHRNAPVGTIMRIRNEENDVTIFARVVGKLPETGDNGRLLIKVSKAAYEQLRAVNSRFPVEVSY